MLMSVFMIGITVMYVASAIVLVVAARRAPVIDFPD
jgi:hypothetical protein